jgi:predicted dienelactone hydrolase
MRPLEILTPLVLAIYLLHPLTGKKRPPAVGILPAFALVIIATHARVEGMRWQMIPLYAFTVATLLLSIPAFFRTAQNETPTRQPLRVILNLSLLAISTALPILLPVPAIPVPDGPYYAVGTTIYELTDTSRRELYSGRDEARRFQIQIWYPAEAETSAERAPWMANADIFAPAISSYLELPDFFLDHLALVKVPAYEDAPVAPTDEGFPVILFSHGWNGFNAQNTGQALQLASHGYVVVGIQHTYGAVVTVFEDGTVARNNPSALPSGAPDDEYEAAAQKLADQWAGDMAQALDSLTLRNSDTRSPFYEKLDLDRIGVYGHSTGGGAAIQFCGTDARCKALLGQDPFMRPVSTEVLKNGVTQPSFFIFSQEWADLVDSRNNKLFDPFYARCARTYGALFIEGTAHYDFSDLPLLSPLAPQLGLKGPINGKRVTGIVNDYLLSFFDMTLKGIPTNLFDPPSPYPEVKPK